MREYVEWEQGRTRVRIHRRVLAGLEREGPGSVAGVVFGTVSPSGTEVAIEDYAAGTATGSGSLEPVGYFRLGDGADVGEGDVGLGLHHVMLMFRRDPDGVTLERLYVKQGPGAGAAVSTGAGHRVLYRAGEATAEREDELLEDRSWRRFLWPAVAIAAGLVIGAMAYMWMSGGVRGGTEAARERPADPMPAPSPAVNPPAPEPAPKQQATPATSSADRSIEPSRPVSRAERAEIQKQVRAAIERWSQSLLRGDVDGHAAVYAQSVGPYFTKNRVSRGEVAEEVRRMLKRYGPLTTYKISDVSVAATDSDHAIANFRKRWSTEGGKFAGEEKEQLKFVRDGSEWRIASEQELKVYWVRRK
jgi:hypothetical protein